MKTHSLIQGSKEWLAYRHEYDNASEAAAMLGLSKTTTRSELLRMKHTGIGKEFSDFVQRNVLDRGHEVEAKVRPLVEAMIGEELYPVTCSNGRQSASTDGLTMSEEIAFECKQWNAEIAAQVAAGVMPEQHMPQCQQILMVTGAKKLIFAVGDGTTKNLLTIDVSPDAEWFKRIKYGWAQFAADLENYVPEVVEAAPVGRTPETLPALHIEVTGMVTASNLSEYKSHALAVFASVNRELKTDQDFADAKKAIKWAGDIETRLQAAKEHALSQTESIDVLFKTIDDITEEARRVRLELNNLVKTRDTALKVEIVTGGHNALNKHIQDCNQRIGRPLMPAIPADFAAVIKGMSKFDNMRAAVSTELARAKISANEWADKISLNLEAIHEQDKLAFLFADLSVLALKEPEFVAMAIKNRVADHHAAEAARLAAETARITEQERIKAEAAAKARADAEIAAATAAAQAEANRASAEAIAKAQAEHSVNPNHAAVIAMAKVLDDAVQVMPGYIGSATPAASPDLKLGQICTRLGFQVTADFLRSLGFEPAGRERAAVLFHEADFARICIALVRHINAVRQGVTA